MGGFSLFGNALEEVPKNTTTAEQPDAINKTSSTTVEGGSSMWTRMEARREKVNAVTPTPAPKADLGTYTQGNTREKLNDKQLIGY